MLIVQVPVQVRPEAVEACRTATVENPRPRVPEPGIARFDVCPPRAEPPRAAVRPLERGRGHVEHAVGKRREEGPPAFFHIPGEENKFYAVLA